MDIYIYIKGNLLNWLTRCAPGNPTISASWWIGKESGSCSIPKIACLSSPSLALEFPGDSWRANALEFTLKS